jgi:NACalpha-BTF3-like transcription factor
MVSAVPPSAEALSAAQSEDRAPIQQADPTAPADLTAPAPAPASAVVSYDAAPRGRLVPAGEPVGTYHREDDTKALAPPEQQTYQPHVLSFTSTSSGLPRSKDSVPPIPVPSLGSSPEAVKALASAVQTQTDKRWAVVSWTQEHPGAGAGLNPQDVKLVLQSVSLSMDQACVALEVARCMGRTHLTCAHVVAACEACAFFKTEVALAMAPYIGDAENKQALLQVLPSYDRARVEHTIVE